MIIDENTRSQILENLVDIEMYFLEKYNISLYEDVLLSEGVLKGVGKGLLTIGKGLVYPIKYSCDKSKEYSAELKKYYRDSFRKYLMPLKYGDAEN